MLRKLLFSVVLFTPFALVATEQGKQQALYDFDHKIHYRQTQLAANKYKLSIREGSYQEFAKQSVFLLRLSAQLCKSDEFNLKLLSGVQEFEKFPTEPRANPGPLVAELTCNI
jgi:hypothetical protein